MRLINRPIATLALAVVVLLLVACIKIEGTTGPVPTTTPSPEILYTIVDTIGTKTDHHGAAVATLEERVYLSDVVVKARFVSAESGVLRFNALEYVKGTGPTKFSVRANTEGRSTQWDSQDAILFLSLIEGETATFEFADTTSWDYVDGPYYPIGYNGSLPEGYTVDSRNPVWLPIESTSGSAAGRVRRSSTPSGTPNVVTEYRSGGVPVTITQQELLEAIEWVAGPLSGGHRSGAARSSDTTTDVSSEDYDNCIKVALMFNRRYRDHETYYGETIQPPVHHKTFASGLGRGVTLLDYGVERGKTYNSYSVFGRDAEMFVSRRTDNDDDPANGYGHDVITARPLPAGTYRVNHQTYPGFHQPCEFQRENTHSAYIVTVTAPPGTLHEAFFDPATTTAGVGYSASAATPGVLEPAGFSFGGRDVNITGLTWHNGQVVLELDRFLQLSESLSFIETDGTVGLYLSQYDATEDWAARTLTWQVSDQPWEPGDELMLRIAPIPLPGVRNLTAETDSAGQAVLSWEVAYTAGVSGYRIWRHQPG